uniref:NADH dehydrogenase subunit 4 n=1 Tax=Rhodella violacea TaxID=2801 RepID=UPI001FCD39EC|nr:NADH dehydrogenase subunit 4 [Rhodella violacea]UNJ19090.1 NADH dehydrogenase subunit 4 [Rhodella violacea]
MISKFYTLSLWLSSQLSLLFFISAVSILSINVYFFSFLFLLVGPYLGAIFLLFIPKEELNKCRTFTLSFSCIVFVASLLVWFLYDYDTLFFQYNIILNGFNLLGINNIVGIDGFNIYFILLTTFLTPVCILLSWGSVKENLKEYLINFLVLEGLLINALCVLDIVLFYVFFESVLIPMYVIIGIWGSRQRKIRAAYQIFLYTLVGSVSMLFAILLIYFETGATNLQVLWYITFTERQQLFLWLAFFISFAVKIPMVPFHIWLPEAHAEAPTAGSVILAGVLLKLGGYGFLRFSLPMFPIASIYFKPLVFVLSIIAVIYGSLTTLRQVDLKKIIAYSSVAHMGIVTLGLFSGSLTGLIGSLFVMFGHGLVSSGLFICAGILYDRYKTRIIKYYGGLIYMMPIFTVFFLSFILANMGFPGSLSFVGEFLVLLGLFETQPIVCFISGLIMILGAAFSLWFFNRLCFSSLKTDFINVFQDISRREFWILFPLFFLTLFLGLIPNYFLDMIYCTSLGLFL